MNKGLLPEEIASAITLPPELAASPFLYEFYGTVRWSVKSIFNGYLGWFSGEPVDLDPLSKKDKAKRLSLLAGGDEELFLELEDAIIKKDMQWSLELISYLESIDYKSNQLKSYKKEALEYIGKRSSNPNKRNYFLVSAQEIDLKPDDQRNMLTAETLNDMHVDTFFKILATRYNPSLNNNDGNINGATLDAADNGSLKFGSGDYVTIPDTADIVNTNFTIEVWFKLDSTTNQWYITTIFTFIFSGFYIIFNNINCNYLFE